MIYASVRKTLLTLISACSLVVVLTVPSVAQQQAPPMFQVIQVELHNGAASDFISGHREVITPKMRELGVPLRYVSRRVLGNTNVFQMIRPIRNLAQVNLNLQLSDVEQNAVQNLIVPSIASRTQFVMQLRPQMSLQNTGFGGYTVVYRLQVKGDRVGDFMELWVDEVIPAFNASGIQGTQVYQTVQGGNLTEFWTATPVPGLPEGAGLGGGPFAGLGPQAAADLNRRLNEMTDAVELYWDQVLGDLSYGLNPPSQ